MDAGAEHVRGETFLLTGELKGPVEEMIPMDSLCNNYRFVCKRDRLDCVLEGGDSKAESGDLFLYSPLKVIIFVALMSGMLLLMYFFYNILGK